MGAQGVTFKESQRAAGREYLQRVLAEKRGNVTKAAMEAEVSRAGFYKLMDRYGLAPRLPRRESSKGLLCAAMPYVVRRTG